jgi:hypothetical protein
VRANGSPPIGGAAQARHTLQAHGAKKSAVTHQRFWSMLILVATEFAAESRW